MQASNLAYCDRFYAFCYHLDRFLCKCLVSSCSKARRMSTQGGSGSGSQYPPEHEQEPPPQKKQKSGDDKDNKQPEKLNPWGDECYTDSEDEFNDGTRKLTREERARYNKQVEESGGFDVESFTQTFECIIRPVTYFDEFPELKDYSDQAIREYNTQNNTNYQFVEVLKANVRVISGLEYYITFAAKEDSATADGGGQSPPEIFGGGQSTPEIFQTYLYAPIGGERKIYFCRLKPKS